MKVMKSKVNYFDVKIGDVVEVLSFHPVKEQEMCKDGSVEQQLDYYKVTLPKTDKVHYLFAFETEGV